MTSGEKMVWAAVFAREMEVLKNPPPYISAGPVMQWKEWECNQACAACETAWVAVERLREAISTGRLHEGFGNSVCDGVVRMATEMLVKP
jgi:hypothetical protein